MSAEYPSHQTAVQAHQGKTLAEWVAHHWPIFCRVWLTNKALQSSKCRAKCVSLYYPWLGPCSSAAYSDLIHPRHRPFIYLNCLFIRWLEPKWIMLYVKNVEQYFKPNWYRPRLQNAKVFTNKRTHQSLIYHQRHTHLCITLLPWKSAVLHNHECDHYIKTE